MAVEPFGFSDLSQLDPLQPHGWSSIIPFYQFYSQTDFCYPIKFMSGGKIIGIGSAILHGHTGWLAHIIVDTNFRGQGIGTKITQELVQQARRSGAKTISLLASALGEPVYRKLGFVKDTDYLFLKGEKVVTSHHKKSIPFNTTFKNGILELDARISGEDRSKLLTPHLASAKIIMDQNNLSGFYLPSLGEGLIIAETPEAGSALMSEKYQDGEGRAVLPKENEVGISFLLKNNFTQFLTGSRMHLGTEIDWHPSKIYNRIGGNLG